MVRIEGAVLDPARRLVPVDALGLIGPEPIRVLDRALVHRAIVIVLDIGAPKPIGRNFVEFVRHRPALLVAPELLEAGALAFLMLLCDDARTSDKGARCRTFVVSPPESGRGHATLVWRFRS